MMQLPDDTHLAYVVTHEAWYSKVPGAIGGEPSVGISASAAGGGVAWEFAVEAVDLGSPSLRLKMFWDSFDAFAQIPDFFAGLRQIGNGTLADVRALLDRLGAVDETQRQSPYGDKPRPPHCPRCDSPDPRFHPAMQSGGEVQCCPHSWHEAASLPRSADVQAVLRPEAGER